MLYMHVSLRAIFFSFLKTSKQLKYNYLRNKCLSLLLNSQYENLPEFHQGEAQQTIG